MHIQNRLRVVCVASCVVLSVGKTHVVEEGHGVTAVDGKHQGKKAEKTGLEGCHAVLEVQVQYVSCQIQQMWVRKPCCRCGCGCDEEEL